MGASQGKESVPLYNRRVIVPPPTTVHAIQSLLQPSNLEQQHHTLDRTLKGFLKHCHLTGLEYRLRLAGIYTLEDLVLMGENKLCRHGFTQLMAKRLFTALDEYLSEPDEPMGVPTSSRAPPISIRRRPSEMARRAQLPFTRASTLMRSQKNYGKMNTKRSRSTHKTPPPNRRPLSLKMPNEIRVEDEEGEFLVTMPTTPPPTGKSAVGVVISVEVEPLPAANGSIVNSELPKNELTNLEFSDFTPPTDEATKQRETTPKTMPYASFLLETPPVHIERSLSLPSGLHKLSGQTDQFSISHYLMRRCTSCPSLFYDLTADHAHQEWADPVTEPLEILKDALNRIDDVICALYVLLDLCKDGRWKLKDVNNIEWIARSMENYLHDLELVEVGCRVLKYLSYDLVTSDDLSVKDSVVYSLICGCVVDALKLHPHSQRVQLNGSLVLSNVLRLDPSLGGSLMNSNLLRILLGSMRYFSDNSIILLAIMNALGSLVSSAPDSRQVFWTDFQNTLLEAANVMMRYLEHQQLQTYSLSFITLAIIDVGAQLDNHVAEELITALVCTVSNHLYSTDIATWACKGLSQIVPHEIAQNQAISESITDCMFNVLSHHSKSSRVQMWGSYTLYQQVSYNKSLFPLIQDTGIIEQCQKSLPHLSSNAQSYIRTIAEVATL